MIKNIIIQEKVEKSWLGMNVGIIVNLGSVEKGVPRGVKDLKKCTMWLKRSFVSRFLAH